MSKQIPFSGSPDHSHLGAMPDDRLDEFLAAHLSNVQLIRVGLLDLPLEIREQIYHHVLVTGQPIITPLSIARSRYDKVTALITEQTLPLSRYDLLRTNKQISEEANCVLIRDSRSALFPLPTFNLTNFTRQHRLLRECRYLRIRFGCSNYHIISDICDILSARQNLRVLRIIISESLYNDYFCGNGWVDPPIELNWDEIWKKLEGKACMSAEIRIERLGAPLGEGIVSYSTDYERFGDIGKAMKGTCRCEKDAAGRHVDVAILKTLHGLLLPRLDGSAGAFTIRGPDECNIRSFVEDLSRS